MFGGLNRLLMVTAVAGVALAAVLPGLASASGCNSSTSAVNVYKECTQNGGGSKSSAGGNGSQTGTGTTQPLPSQTQKALNEAGKDKKTLAKLVTAYGLRRQLQTVHGGSGTTPSAVGSAFDLTSGPTALLIILAGTAALLLGGSGVRVWRTRRRAS